jgi:membrane associated rhomboid family serine protease
MATQRPLPRPGAPYRPPPKELLILAGVIVAIELLLELADRGILFDPSLRSRAYMVGAFWAGLLRGMEPIFSLQPYTMFLSHAFLHGGFLHMAMNMAVLLGLGRYVSDRYGAGAILPVFFVSAIAGAAVFGLIAPSEMPMVGASGAVFGFVGVWIVADWRRLRERGLSVRPVATRVLTLAALNVAFFFALSGMLAWEAHLGGFVAGVVCGLWLEARRGRSLRRS